VVPLATNMVLVVAFPVPVLPLLPLLVDTLPLVPGLSP